MHNYSTENGSIRSKVPGVPKIVQIFKIHKSMIDRFVGLWFNLLELSEWFIFVWLSFEKNKQKKTQYFKVSSRVGHAKSVPKK